uniref:Uncharacterized protein n=1 Tax=Aegilops tauschii TaxID=37682 RepID=M8B183_AEGTA
MDATVRSPAPCVLHRCLMLMAHAPAHFLPPSTLPPSQPVDVHMPHNKCGGDHGLSRSASPFFRWLTYYSRRWSSTWRSLPCPKHHFGRSCPPLCDDCSNADQVFGVMSERPQVCMFAVMRIHQFVMSLEVGVVPEDGDQWRALAHCFWDDTAKTNKDDDHVPISSGFVQVLMKPSTIGGTELSSSRFVTLVSKGKISQFILQITVGYITDTSSIIVVK